MGVPKVKEVTFEEGWDKAQSGGEEAVSSNHEVGSEVRDSLESTLGDVSNTSGTLEDE